MRGHLLHYPSLNKTASIALLVKGIYLFLVPRGWRFSQLAHLGQARCLIAAGIRFSNEFRVSPHRWGATSTATPSLTYLDDWCQLLIRGSQLALRREVLWLFCRVLIYIRFYLLLTITLHVWGQKLMLLSLSTSLAWYLMLLSKPLQYFLIFRGCHIV